MSCVDPKLRKKWKEIQERHVKFRKLVIDGKEVEYQDWSKNFLNFCEINGIVLDIGCGPFATVFHQEINEKCERYIGLDPELSFIRSTPPKIIYVRGIGEALPFKSEVFDCVIMKAVLDHAFDPAMMLHEAFRVLKTGGKLWLGEGFQDKHPILKAKRFVKILLAFGLKKALYAMLEFLRAQVFLKKIFKYQTGHMRQLTKNDILKLIKQAGFYIEKITEHSGGRAILYCLGKKLT
jgi:ubiquinone/menaquinone biosynthesis C-methylase UbiE